MSKPKIDIRQIVTDLILAKLEEGIIPWHKPFTATCGDGSHRNLVSKKAYRGINPFLLDCQGYAQPWWLTMNQCNKIGGTVRKGERSTVVVFNSPVERKCGADAPGARITPKGPMQTIWLMRYYRVFNVEQCEGIDHRVPQPDPDAPVEAEPLPMVGFLREWCEGEDIRLSDKGDGAYYAPVLDKINIPPLQAFVSHEDYALTFAHEAIHATGHADRLDRQSDKQFGSEGYAKEELVAELGCAMLGMQWRIGSEDRHIAQRAAYIQSWMKAIKDDKYLVTSAASAAQRACDFIAPIASTVGEPIQTEGEAQAVHA